MDHFTFDYSSSCFCACFVVIIIKGTEKDVSRGCEQHDNQVVEHFLLLGTTLLETLCLLTKNGKQQQCCSGMLDSDTQG